MSRLNMELTYDVEAVRKQVMDLVPGINSGHNGEDKKEVSIVGVTEGAVSYGANCLVREFLT